MWRFVFKILFFNRTRMLSMLTSLAGAMLLMVWLTSALFGIRFGFADFIIGGGVPVWVCSNRLDVYMQPENMPEMELDRVRSVSGVAKAYPLSYGACNLKIPGKENIGAQIIGVDDESLAGIPLNHLDGNPHAMRGENIIAIDQNLLHSRLNGILIGSELILNANLVKVGVILECKAHSMALPVVYCTCSNFRRWTKIGEAPGFAFILVYPEKGFSAEAVVAAINRNCSGLIARTQEKMAAAQSEWLKDNTSMTAILAAAIFICGLFAVLFLSQQFYAFILENTEGLAVMKSLGYSHSDLCRFVFLGGGCVWLLSFVMVFILSGAMIRIMAFFPKILYHTPWWIIFPIGGLMFVICMFSGASVLWKIRRIDPMLLFKS